jgi:hypothetical protein
LKNTKGKGKRVKVNTLKALADTLAMSDASTTTLLIILFVLWARALLVTPFLLSVDRGKLSATGLVSGPCMIEEIKGALWPIYGILLGGQY